MRCRSLAESWTLQSSDVWQTSNAILNKNLFITNLLYQFSVLFVIISGQFSYKLKKIDEKPLNRFLQKKMKHTSSVAVHRLTKVLLRPLAKNVDCTQLY